MGCPHACLASSLALVSAASAASALCSAKSRSRISSAQCAATRSHRAALAAASDPPDPNCPIGARVRVRFDEVDGEEGPFWFEGYLVEHRTDGKSLCVFEDGDSDWYGLEDDGLTVLGL